MAKKAEVPFTEKINKLLCCIVYKFCNTTREDAVKKAKTLRPAFDEFMHTMLKCFVEEDPIISELTFDKEKSTKTVLVFTNTATTRLIDNWIKENINPEYNEHSQIDINLNNMSHRRSQQTGNLLQNKIYDAKIEFRFGESYNALVYDAGFYKYGNNRNKLKYNEEKDYYKSCKSKGNKRKNRIYLLSELDPIPHAVHLGNGGFEDAGDLKYSKL